MPRKPATCPSPSCSGPPPARRKLRVSRRTSLRFGRSASRSSQAIWRWIRSRLADLFRGFDWVVSCVGFASGPGTQIKIAQAVLAAGVRRYVPWQFGMDYDLIGRGSAQELFDEHVQSRRADRTWSYLQSPTRWPVLVVVIVMVAGPVTTDLPVAEKLVGV